MTLLRRRQLFTLLLVCIGCHLPRLRIISAFTSSRSQLLRNSIYNSNSHSHFHNSKTSSSAADDSRLSEEGDKILLDTSLAEGSSFSPNLSSKYSGDNKKEQAYEDDDRESDVQNFARNPEWLVAATSEILDLEHYPIGHLTPDDIEYITSLILAWSRRWLPGGPSHLESLLKRVVDDMKAGNRDVSVSTTMYTAAIEAWGKSGADGRAERAQNIHDALIHQYQESGNPLIAPSVLSFNTLMNAWAKSGEPDAPGRVEYVLTQMRECKVDDSFLMPDAVTISTMLDAYSRSSEGVNLTRCEELFEMADRW